MCPLLVQPIIAFFSSFLLRPFTVLMKQTRQAVRAVKQSRFLDVYAGNTKGGSITVLLTSCLTGLESAVWQLTIIVFICKTD